MLSLLEELREHIVIGVVGGSDLPKQLEQLGEDALQRFDWNFPENGLVAFKQGSQFFEESLAKFLGEARLQEFLNFTLAELAKIELPLKRGNFIEFRKGMINVSPVGRNCSKEERAAYEKFDLEHGIRAKLIATLSAKFPEFKYSIGGQISFDVFPHGWDKTFCLRHVESEHYAEIHFFGDKTDVGGNDYEIFTSPLTIGHSVKSPADTMALCRSLFLGQ
eukprot:TRINITY_DN1792_c0_g1_i3.p2 TRINITY_DN1792_c0_g1~~TRINITY_DN1792_c0_g1_i3.p2  ORF type:complete len:220 (-),score=73.01 TRINITY_DN1792_c0_g1_i3:66-725(-)